MSKVSETVRANAIFNHDMFNIVVMFAVSALSATYVVRYTKTENIGTANHISDCADDNICHYTFFSLYAIFFVYIIADMLWIYFIPHCVASKSPVQILFHHLVTFIMIFNAILDSHFHWHLAATLLCESNTLFLACRRNTQRGTILNKISEISFYLSWLLFRMISFPLLTYVCFWETFYRLEQYPGEYINIASIGFVSYVILTVLSFGWTFEIFAKNFMAKEGAQTKTQ